MTKSPKISVIIPVYNVEKYLRQCLDSVINQTLKDIEIILIDDGGKDLCPRIIDEYAAKDSRIKAIHKQNGGYGQSCNVGLDTATGEYIAIVEPDDFIEQDMYEDLYNIAMQYNSDIVKSSFYEEFDSNKRKWTSKVYWDRIFNLPEHSFQITEAPMFLFFHPSIWSCIYKKEFLKENNIRFVEAPGAGWTDNPFQVQTMCLAKKINYTKKAYYHWRILNLNPSEELKDYKIPFLRCNEMRAWLKKNNFNNETIMEAYYAREFIYIFITLGMKISLKNSKNYISYLQEMIKEMDGNIVVKSIYISPKDKILYKKLLKNTTLEYYKIKYLRKLKHIFSIENKGQHKVLTMLGIKFKFKRH